VQGALAHNDELRQLGTNPSMSIAATICFGQNRASWPSFRARLKTSRRLASILDQNEIAGSVNTPARFCQSRSPAPNPPEFRDCRYSSGKPRNSDLFFWGFLYSNACAFFASPVQQLAVRCAVKQIRSCLTVHHRFDGNQPISESHSPARLDASNEFPQKCRQARGKQVTE